MIFLLKVMFYDVIKNIHDVIITANLILYTVKFMFVVLGIINIIKADNERWIEDVHNVVVYQKYLSR